MIALFFFVVFFQIITPNVAARTSDAKPCDITGDAWIDSTNGMLKVTSNTSFLDEEGYYYFAVYREDVTAQWRDIGTSATYPFIPKRTTTLGVKNNQIINDPLSESVYWQYGGGTRDLAVMRENSNDDGSRRVYLFRAKWGQDEPICLVDSYTATEIAKSGTSGSCTWQIKQARQIPNKPGVNQWCYFDGGEQSCLENNTEISVSVRGLTFEDEPYTGTGFLDIKQQGIGPGQGQRGVKTEINNGAFETTFVPTSRDQIETYFLSVSILEGGIPDYTFPCNASITVKGGCIDGTCQTAVVNLENESRGPNKFNLCDQIDPNNKKARDNCDTCYENEGIWTAIGCIPRDAPSIIATLIRVGLSMAGGFGLISILVAGFMYSTSQGDVKRANDAREMMTAAIIGLLFIIFSVAILEFIGVSVLRLPGFADV